MYPLIRSIYHKAQAKKKPKLDDPFGVSTINMRVWPWDIDMFMELNNGRYLTLMDIGRFELGARLGLFEALKDNGWGLMVGAVSSRYRRRLRPFQKFELHTKVMSFDERWFYFRQWFQVGEQTHASFLVRVAVVSKKGLVPSENVINAMNLDQNELATQNQKSEWVQKWEASDTLHKQIMEDK